MTAEAPEAIQTFALLVAAAAALLSAAMVLAIVAMRLVYIRRARREARFLERWRPLLLESVDAVPAHLPTVKRPDWFAFLALWNHFQESLRGGGRHRLKAVAIRLRMDLAARRLLAEGSAAEVLMAVLTLGHLGDHDSWEQLEKFALSEHPTRSLAAARSLMLIDPARAAPVLVPAFTMRADWPLPRLLAILTEAGAAAITPALAAAIDDTAPEHLPRMLALLDRAESPAVVPRIQALIERGAEDEILIACLKSAHVPRNRSLLAGLTRHPSWQVRTQAARAFALAARPGDEKLLVALLSDRVWWVRRRAAEALAGLPFVSREDLLRSRASVSDRFGQNMLDQVIAERHPG